MEYTVCMDIALCLKLLNYFVYNVGVHVVYFGMYTYSCLKSTTWTCTMYYVYVH